MSKKVEESFKQLSKKEQKELIQKYVAQENISTDEDSYHEERDGYKITEVKDVTIDPKIFREYFEAIDQYGKCGLSLDFQTKNFGDIKEVFGLKNLSDAEMLKKFALSMCNKDYITNHNIDHNVATTVFGEARDQLELMGEDVTNILETYNNI